MIIKNGSTTSEAVTLQTYFGRHEGQTLTSFMGEVKKLTPADKTELAHGAALALGYTIE